MRRAHGAHTLSLLLLAGGLSLLAPSLSAQEAPAPAPTPAPTPAPAPAPPPASAVPAPAPATTDQDTSVEIELLQILREQGVITEAQFDGLLARARARADAHLREVSLIEASLQRLAAPDVSTRGGTPGKLQFKSQDGKWSMGIRGLIQARAEDANSDAPTADGTNFSVARSRLAFEGNAGSKDITYKLEMDAATQSTPSQTSSTKNFILRDTYINDAFTPWLALRFGQFKVPIGREELTPTPNLSLIDKSIASLAFTPQYEPGAMLHGRLEEGVFEYFFGLFNGQGPSQNNPTGQDRNGLRTAARVVWNPMGPFTPLESSAFQTVNDGSTKIGLGLSWNDNKDSTANTVVTPGANTATTGIDGQILSGPWSFFTDLFFRNSDFAGTAPDTDDSGQTFQLGYFLVPDKWEIVARHSEIDFDVADDQKEETVGLNYYVDKNNGKWQLDFSKLDNDGNTPDASRVRVQYQLVF